MIHVLGVVSELEREKAKVHFREKEISSLQTKVNRDKEQYLKKINNLEQDFETSRKTYEQQLISERNTHSIENDTKKYEIDSIKRQLSLQTSEAHGNRVDWEELRKQLINKDIEITDYRRKLQDIEEERGLEENILKVDLQCAKLEQKLAIHRGSVAASRTSKEHANGGKEIVDMLQKLRKESERMKAERKAKN